MYFTEIILILIVVCGVSISGNEKQKTDHDIVIGIDLGTTYSCVGIYKNCHVEIIENDQGNRITPSYVTFLSDGERLVGDAAKNLLTSNPENTIFHVKRLIGRKFDEPLVQKDIQSFPFRVTEKNNRPIININTEYGEKQFTPEEISAMVLAKMRMIAEEYLGKKVRNAVITVPAYFNNAQREATKDAGTIAGLHVLRIINEPTAAALAYGLDKLKAKEKAKNILVYDLGGGTFDVSLLTFDDGVFEVLATNGDTHLGGEDFDQRVINYFVDLFRSKTGKSVAKNVRSLQKLRREVEKAKRTLSFQHQTKIEIESFYQNEDFTAILTRAKFEELNNDLFRSTLRPVSKVLKDGKLERTNIDEILLVGGSTRIPKIRQIIKEYFYGKEPSRNVNPDEAVAYGAAIQAGVLSNEECTNEIVVLDVNPLTLGIETVGGVMSNIIPRNSPIPVLKESSYTTAADNQETVTILIYEGERPMTKDNHLLGKFNLAGIIPAPRGTPTIQVTFDINADGILNVTALDVARGVKKNIVINSNTNRLPKHEIDRMIKDAEKFAEKDKYMKERVDAINDLESYLYIVKRSINDPKVIIGMLSSREKQTIENHVKRYMEWLEGKPNADTDEFINRKNRLEFLINSMINEFIRRNPAANDTQWLYRRNSGEL